MVENVEGIRAQIEGEPLGNLRRLFSRQIDRSKARSIDHIPGHVSETVTRVLVTA